MSQWFSPRAIYLVVLGVGAVSSGCSDDEGDDGFGLGGSMAQSSGGSSQGTGGADSAAGGSSMGSGGNAASSGRTPVQSSFPDAQAYVDAHNAVRATVVEPVGYTGTWEPLPPVTWSDTVAQSAQQWADYLRDNLNCGLQHDASSGYGENLAAGSNLSPQSAMDMWAAEARDYTYSSNYSFDSATGHYTQIVWRDSTEIGCASATCGSSTVIVCRYSPPGNNIGRAPY